MVPGSIIVTPQVLISRDQPYTAVKTIDLGTPDSETSSTITVPEDMLVTSHKCLVYARDVDGKTYPITEDDVDRDQYKILIKVAGRADHAEAPQDVFSFNRAPSEPGFQGFTLPKNTDVTIKCLHVSNGTKQGYATFRFHVELIGYEILAQKKIAVDQFVRR